MQNESLMWIMFSIAFALIFALCILRIIDNSKNVERQASLLRAQDAYLSEKTQKEQNEETYKEQRENYEANLALAWKRVRILCQLAALSEEIGKKIYYDSAEYKKILSKIKTDGTDAEMNKAKKEIFEFLNIMDKKGHDFRNLADNVLREEALRYFEKCVFKKYGKIKIKYTSLGAELETGETFLLKEEVSHDDKS